MSENGFEDLHFSKAPTIITKPPGRKSIELRQKQTEFETFAVSYPKSIPIAFEEGKGATLRDVDGNIYIDFLAGAGVLNVGHCNPEVVEAAKQQMEKLTHNLDFPTPIRMELIDEIISILPNNLKENGKIFFVAPTGADAIESAMKLAKFNTGRNGMISFEGGYHGMTAGALALTADKRFKKRIMPLIPEVHFIPYAYCYRCSFGKEYPECDFECAKYLEHILRDPYSGVVDPAAIIIEAVQGEGGTIPAPDEYIVEVRRISKEYSIPLIIDEIQAGVCRTGKMWACQHSGITPDIMTISKGVAGGLPLSVLAFDKEFDTWESGYHVGTFRGNVVAVAAAVATIQFIKNHKLWDHAARLGKEVFLTRLKELQDESKFIGDVRGKGMMIGIEFVKHQTNKKPYPEIVKEVHKECYQKGLLTEIGGHYSNVIRFLPPLVLTKDIAEIGVEIFMESVKKVEASK